MRLGTTIAGIVIALNATGCLAESASAPREDADGAPIDLVVTTPQHETELDAEVLDLLDALEVAPTGSTVRYQREITLEDGSVVLDPVVVTILDEPLDELAEDADVTADPYATATTIDGPVPIASCNITATISTQSRSRSWESCLVFPDSEARADALRAVSAAVESVCRTTLSGTAPSCPAGSRFVSGVSTISTDGICEVESRSSTITHTRGTLTCWLGATRTFVSTARATSTGPRCGFACQSLN